MPHATCLLLRRTEEPLSSGPIMQAVWGRELNASCVSLWPELTHCIPPKVNVWWRRDGEPEIHRAALFSISGTTGRQESQGQGFIWIKKRRLARYINQCRCTVASTVENESAVSVSDVWGNTLRVRVRCFLWQSHVTEVFLTFCSVLSIV